MIQIITKKLIIDKYNFFRNNKLIKIIKNIQALNTFTLCPYLLKLLGVDE